MLIRLHSTLALTLLSITFTMLIRLHSTLALTLLSMPNSGTASYELDPGKTCVQWMMGAESRNGIVGGTAHLSMFLNFNWWL